MTIDCVRAAKLKIAGIIVNGYNAVESTVAEDTAAETIAKCSGADVLAVVPFDETVSIEKPNLGEVILASLAGCDWEKLAGL
jgi:dethiobiotin synthetase